MSARINLFLISGAELQETDGGGLRVTAPPNRYRPPMDLPKFPPGVIATLGRLRGQGASIQELVGEVVKSGGMAGIGAFHKARAILAYYGVIGFRLFAGDETVAILEPLSNGFQFREGALGEGQLVLSRFAYLRREEDGIVIESPRGHARVQLATPAALHLVGTLHQPRSIDELVAEAGDWGEEATRAFLNLLANVGALAEVDDDGELAEDSDPILAPWEFADMVFHSRSRQGRSGGAYGGTYPFQGRWEPLPITKPPMSEHVVPLHRPDLDRVIESDPPFGRVLESRRSLRDHAEAPITVDQLGEFLYRSARVQKSVDDAGVSWRPHPGGGALHELEIYPIVNACEGLESGMWHYDALRHELQRVCDLDSPVRVISGMAGAAAEMQGEPQVVLVIAARFQRIQRKYRSVSYAVTLKNVGALYQTFYLVATSMGLAPCAVGGGNSDLFSGATGLDYLEETSVGEFLLGSRGG